MLWSQQKAQVPIRICITILNISMAIQLSLLALDPRRRNLQHRCSAFTFPQVCLVSTILFRRSNSSPRQACICIQRCDLITLLLRPLTIRTSPAATTAARSPLAFRPPLLVIAPSLASVSTLIAPPWSGTHFLKNTTTSITSHTTHTPRQSHSLPWLPLAREQH